MKFQRLSILVFAAALTAGTCAATSVQFNLYVGAGGQTVSLSVDGSVPVTNGGSGNLVTVAQNYTDGWHSIAIDYTDNSGTNSLLFQVNSDAGVPFASYNAIGSTINGLKGVYYVLDGLGNKTGTPLATDYGEGPIYFPNMGPWKTLNLPSAFEEDLTGFIYLGTGTPLLSDVPASQQTPPPSDPPPTDGGAAPEPAGWWLMAAALPLMLFSKLRLRRAKACQ
jgi:hypothetical protein